MKELINEYVNQDNACTAYPIYVALQELQFVCIFDESYGTNSQGVIKYHYTYEDQEGWSDSKEECVDQLIEYMKGCTQEEIDRAINNINEFACFYMWIDIEYFLTKKGAENYLKLDRHNLGRTRTYIKHFSNRNKEMRKVLDFCGLPICDNKRNSFIAKIKNNQTKREE